MMQIIKKLKNACFEYDDKEKYLEIKTYIQGFGNDVALSNQEARALYKFLHKIFGEEKK